MRDPKRAADRLLQAAGFECIECPDGSLKTDVRMDESSRAARYLESDRAYYEAAGRWLHEHEFSDAQERQIWELHSQGVGVREMSPIVGASKSAIHRRLAPLVVEFLKRFKLGRPGRPEKPDGYGRHAYELRVKLNPQQTDALWFLAQTFDLDVHDAARHAFLTLATALLAGAEMPKK